MRVVTTAFMALAMAGPAAAQTARAESGDTLAVARPGEAILHGTDSVQTATCDGGSIMLGGSGNRATVTGDCERVVVGGSRNEVRVRLASGAQVMVGGDGNRVIWTSAAGALPPEVIRAGEGNVVEQGGR